MLHLIYTALLYVAAPIALAVTWWRGFRDRAYRDRLGERWGFTRLRFDAPVIWLHAVSMGEVQASAPLVRQLRQRYPQLPLLMTTATPTGAQRVSELFKGDVQHAFLPYDLPGAVARFLDRARPRIAIVIETEVWPNLFHACTQRGVPLVMASARLSARSEHRLRWAASLFRPLFAGDITIGAQTRIDADRFIALGAQPARVQVTGNIKFDIEIPADTQHRGQAAREAQFAHRFAWIAGSTHEGEEQIVLDAHAQIREQLPGALLILVPRHPQRFAQVRQWLQAQDIVYVTRSSGASITDAHSVLLIDTMGELQMFYAAADVAFVGGTLVRVGGHNLLEPAALSVPVLAGPHNFNAPDIARLLFAEGAALQVSSAAQLSAQVIALALDGNRRRDMGSRGRAVVEANRGAVTRAIALIEGALGDRR